LGGIIDQSLQHYRLRLGQFSIRAQFRKSIKNQLSFSDMGMGCRLGGYLSIDHASTDLKLTANDDFNI
jgi:hypothetical protein